MQQKQQENITQEDKYNNNDNDQDKCNNNENDRDKYNNNENDFFTLDVLDVEDKQNSMTIYM